MIQISSENMDGVWFTAAVNEKGQLVACAFSDRNKEAAELAVKETVPVDFSTQNDSFLNRKLQELRGLFFGRGRMDLKELDLSRASRISGNASIFSFPAFPGGKSLRMG